jgi:general secretion pathway protein M
VEELLRLWNERAPRERLVLAALGVVILLTLVYLILVEPAWTGIRQLERSLPQTRAQAGQLDALLGEVKTLKARPPVATVGPSEVRSAVEKSLGGAGLKASRIAALADGDLQIGFANVPYAQWAGWLANIERELGARALRVTANATSTPGNADVEIALRVARR